MSIFLFQLSIVMAISVLVDWVSSVLIAFSIYFMWALIATGGIIR